VVGDWFRQLHLQLLCTRTSPSTGVSVKLFFLTTSAIAGQTNRETTALDEVGDTLAHLSRLSRLLPKSCTGYLGGWGRCGVWGCGFENSGPLAGPGQSLPAGTFGWQVATGSWTLRLGVLV
jgi:hypothetical protein